MRCFDISIHYQMITTIKSVNIAIITSHSYLFFGICSDNTRLTLSQFQVCNALTSVTMRYIRFPHPSDTCKGVPFDKCLPSPSSPAPEDHCSTLCYYEFDFPLLDSTYK